MTKDTGLTARLRALLTHRRTPLFLAVLALVLTLPALRGGFVMDDYFQRNVLLHRGEWSAARPLWDLFAFVPADQAAWMRDCGIPPWWSGPGALIHFARPLTALTHMLDYALWPDSPLLQHLHSLFWYALAVGLAAALYRRLHASPAVAGVAGLLFAVADSHAMAVGWLSGRNGLLCLVCGLGALHQHLSWRKTGSLRFLASALLLFALGLGCGEAAIGALAYFAAWQLAVEEGSWKRRILPLAPYAGVVVLWRALYVAYGFGTKGSSMYLDPGSEPRLFLQAFIERAPLLTAAQWVKAPVDLSLILSRQTQLTASILAALLATGLLALLWPLLRKEASFTIARPARLGGTAVTREYLAYLLGQEPSLQVVGTAKDGMEAVEQAERLRPDVILMDVHMPRLNGFEATRLIMERAPTPIVIVSASFKRDETALTFEALKAGALTVVEKPLGLEHPGQAESVAKLVEAVRLMAEVKVVRRWPRRDRPRSAPAAAGQPDRVVRIVAIGASTGGPAAVSEILETLPPDLGAPILVVQHIAPGFTEGFVEWLGQGTRLQVKRAEAQEPVRPGTVYVAPERFQMGITKPGRIRLAQEPAEDGFCPSASHLFESLAEAYGPSALGILLTGMGRDGAQGLLRLREAGAVTIAQDQETSVVFGMPQEAIRIGAAKYVLPPEGIAGAIAAWTRAGVRP